MYSVVEALEPRQSPAYGTVLPRFVEQVLQDRPVTVYGAGSPVRSFTIGWAKRPPLLSRLEER